jgi:CheY-like chemotaxis protein/HPt (histidine-containing phosphotransfer) domain-containing protein
VALGGEEAIEKFKSRNFDLILLDIQMPGTSGIEVAETIRSSSDENKRNVPIIALTANVFTRQLKNKESVFNDVLLKPFKEEALLTKMKQVLNGKESKAYTEPAHFSDSPDAQPDQLFNLKYLKRISGANREFELQMLRLFIQNNTNHIRRLNEALDAEDWGAINQLAHKMVPQFRYLQIHQTEEKLKLLEELTADKKHLGKIPALVKEICSVTKKVIISIEEEINSPVHEDLLQSTAPDKFVNNPNL